MVTIEKLKEQRNKEAKRLQKMQEKLKLKTEKKKLKEDIRKIQGASLRARFGVSKQDVGDIHSSFKRAFKGTSKQLFSIGKGVGKVLMATGDAANQYYGTAPRQRQPIKHRKKRKKARSVKTSRSGKTITIRMG